MPNSWNHAAGVLLGNRSLYLVYRSCIKIVKFCFGLNKSQGEMTYLDFCTAMILMERRVKNNEF